MSDIDTIPFAEIAATKDRSWTMQLLELVLDPQMSSGVREQSADVLLELSDGRVRQPLIDAVQDTSLYEPVRIAAMALLAGLGFTPEGQHRRGWWQSGDPLLQEYALIEADLGDADWVFPILSDPQHPLYATAITGTEWGFDLPQWEALKINALTDPRPQIRAIAASALMMDEPLAALDPLLDAVADPEPQVAAAAVRSLEYYAGVRVLRHLSQLRDHEHPDVATAATQAFEGQRFTLQFGLRLDDPGQVAAMREWMQPVWDLVDPGEQQPTEPSAVAQTQLVPVDTDSVREQLSDLDGKWAGRLELLVARVYAWDQVADAERPSLIDFLSTHPDRDVRQWSGQILALWGATGTLIELTGDDDGLVAKSAMYYLGEVPTSDTSPDAAATAWAYVAAATTSGTRASEALKTYAHHGDSQEVQPRLHKLIRSDPREQVRAEAIDLVADASSLGWVLGSEPTITWALHQRVLAHPKPPELREATRERLAAVDEYHLHQSLVTYLAKYPAAISH